jgi:phage terminase Nu1 subunit (DNA packaging protein)
MSTAAASGTAHDAGVVAGPEAVGNSHLADALAELEAAEARVRKVEETRVVVKASLAQAQARVAALQREGE